MKGTWVIDILNLSYVDMSMGLGYSYYVVGLFSNQGGLKIKGMLVIYVLK